MKDTFHELCAAFIFIFGCGMAVLAVVTLTRAATLVIDTLGQ